MKIYNHQFLVTRVQSVMLSSGGSRGQDRGKPKPNNVPCLRSGRDGVRESRSCPTLQEPMDYSLAGSSAPGILQARILEWVAMSSSRGSSRSRDQTQDPGIKPSSFMSPALAGRFFTPSVPWEALP